MISRLKQFLLIGAVIAVFYYLLNHHIFIFGLKDFEILKKVEPTLENTFINLKQSKPRDLLQIDTLVDAGVEDLLVDRGLVTEQRLELIWKQIDDMRKLREQQQ